MQLYEILIYPVVLHIQIVSVISLTEFKYLANCKNKSDGTLQADPFKCDHYYECVGGHAYRRSCRTGRYFDINGYICKLSALVDCVEDKEMGTLRNNQNFLRVQLKTQVDNNLVEAHIDSKNQNSKNKDTEFLETDSNSLNVNTTSSTLLDSLPSTNNVTASTSVSTPKKLETKISITKNRTIYSDSDFSEFPKNKSSLDIKNENISKGISPKLNKDEKKVLETSTLSSYLETFQETTLSRDETTASAVTTASSALLESPPPTNNITSSTLVVTPKKYEANIKESVTINQTIYSDSDFSEMPKNNSSVAIKNELIFKEMVQKLNEDENFFNASWPLQNKVEETSILSSNLETTQKTTLLRDETTASDLDTLSTIESTTINPSDPLNSEGTNVVTEILSTKTAIVKETPEHNSSAINSKDSFSNLISKKNKPTSLTNWFETESEIFDLNTKPGKYDENDNFFDPLYTEYSDDLLPGENSLPFYSPPFNQDYIYDVPFSSTDPNKNSLEELKPESFSNEHKKTDKNSTASTVEETTVGGNMNTTNSSGNKNSSENKTIFTEPFLNNVANVPSDFKPFNLNATSISNSKQNYPSDSTRVNSLNESVPEPDPSKLLTITSEIGTAEKVGNNGEGSDNNTRIGESQTEKLSDVQQTNSANSSFESTVIKSMNSISFNQESIAKILSEIGSHNHNSDSDKSKQVTSEASESSKFVPQPSPTFIYVPMIPTRNEEFSISKSENVSRASKSEHKEIALAKESSSMNGEDSNKPNNRNDKVFDKSHITVPSSSATISSLSMLDANNRENMSSKKSENETVNEIESENLNHILNTKLSPVNLSSIPSNQGHISIIFIQVPPVQYSQQPISLNETLIDKNQTLSQTNNKKNLESRATTVAPPTSVSACPTTICYTPCHWTWAPCHTTPCTPSCTPPPCTRTCTPPPCTSTCKPPPCSTACPCSVSTCTPACHANDDSKISRNNFVYLTKRRFDCLAKPNKFVLLSKKHCRIYHVCQKGKVKTRKCPKNKWYDADLGSCRGKREVKNCAANRD